MHVAQQEQAEGLLAMCQKAHQVHAGQGVSDSAHSMEDQKFAQQEVLGVYAGSSGVG